jgi:hypothetical protein
MLPARQLLRSTRVSSAQIRGIFVTKNTIADTRRKYYENTTKPTYLKEPGDQILFTAAVTGAAIGITTVLYGLFSMSFGINKLKK